MKLKKILIKVVDEVSDSFGWYHVAYADEDLYLDFLERMNCSRVEFADYVSKWASNDFNIELTMAHRNDILILKKLVQNRYRKAHPHIYLDTKTDRQGWMRAWISKNMEEELKFYGKPKTEI